MICYFCKQENGSCSTYNPLHEMECATCRRKRLNIYEDITKEALIEKLFITHRELHCMSLNSKGAWNFLDEEKKLTKECKLYLERWLQYGENTFCESEILINETKLLIKKL
jgi:hypothetical protein